MLPPRNKTARVSPHEHFELASASYTRSHNTHKAWKTLWKHFDSLGAYVNGEKYEGGRVLFISPEKQRTSSQGTYVQWFLPNGPKVASYI
jgi:hypothetical protein